eukprot:GHVR01019037.1.p1 GENE.GHVR01019037.1~~GHVR01019037.1.p1  ORF type:complete len:133 (-),score=13.64 GHVR01019037.1:226-624(-)
MPKEILVWNTDLMRPLKFHATGQETEYRDIGVKVYSIGEESLDSVALRLHCMHRDRLIHGGLLTRGPDCNMPYGVMNVTARMPANIPTLWTLPKFTYAGGVKPEILPLEATAALDENALTSPCGLTSKAEKS